ncbi:hypothetical protein KCP77_20990 [Salmonella enterica subsp. enterica]|nr:hypothetical protein KCP77_20990 [Salmonella enterica subsp. enterica]
MPARITAAGQVATGGGETALALKNILLDLTKREREKSTPGPAMALRWRR